VFGILLVGFIVVGIGAWSLPAGIIAMVIGYAITKDLLT
jgi:hypothetical protein